jgi:glucose-1-phosphate thymidylyltransferase
MRKGIILAGGKGTRLYPSTMVISKHLLPIFDKPMVYYPLTTLMLAGIKEILVISTSQDIERYKSCLQDGKQWGIEIDYAVQDEANGIAEAFIIGEKFIGNSDVALILGDNIFYGHDLVHNLRKVSQSNDEAVVFAYKVKDPERYGVVEFKNEVVISIEEKPKQPKSSYAIPGLYFYANSVIEVSKNIKPSARGELEITAINEHYRAQQKLRVEVLERGFAWFDAGTHESLIDAALYVKLIEERQGMKIGCPEEVAYRSGFITGNQLNDLAEGYSISNPYYKYLKQLIG